MEIIDRFPSLSSNHAWLVGQNLEDGEQFFFTAHDPMSYYRCRIPELTGRCIRGCFHGWIILSDHPHDKYWSLWNPLTSKLIRLPGLILKDFEDSDDKIKDCCLTSPPGHPGSVLLLNRDSVPHFVFCRLDCKRKRIKWIEMSYTKQFISIIGEDGIILRPTCCNGKVYAKAYSSPELYSIVQLDIVCKGKEVEIRLLPFVNFPEFVYNGVYGHVFFNGSYSNLFTIIYGVTKDYKLFDVHLHKMDMDNKEWIEINDLKDTVFFVDMARACNNAVYLSPAISSKLGGYIHFIHANGKAIYSYNIKDKTFSLSSMQCLDLPARTKTNNISSINVWSMPMPDFRLQGKDHDKCKDEDEGMDSRLQVGNDDHDKCKDEVVIRSAMNDELDISFDALDMVMEFCVGMEYLNFRATCKHCRLSAPVIPSNNNRRLQTDSWVSPWLLVFDSKQGSISFTDPMSSDNNCFMKAFPELFNDYTIHCSKYGWLLLFIGIECPAFFNPITNDIRKLPPIPYLEIISNGIDMLPTIPYLESLCFSAPPTSTDCMVIGFSLLTHYMNVFIHFVGREPSWRKYRMDFGDAKMPSFRFPTFCGGDVYALFNGGLRVLREINDNKTLSWETVVDEETSFSRDYYYYHVRCGQHHLLVTVGEFGESLEVFKLNETRKKWEKIDSLGRHMIFISDTTCVCMDAKIPEMENKIFFPRWHCGNRKIVFYSLKTRMYHTFNGKNVQHNITTFYGTKKTAFAHVWIEPTCSL